MCHLFRHSQLSQRLKNPLTGVPRDTLLSDVHNFANRVGLSEHIPMLEKGAIVAQDPSAFESLSEITEDEKHHIRREVTQ